MRIFRIFRIFRIAALLIVMLWVVTGVSWVTNLVKLASCDFAADYKCEVIHLAGILPPVALVTAWFGTDAEKKS